MFGVRKPRRKSCLNMCSRVQDSTSTRHLLAVATATSVYVYDSKPGKLPVAAIEGCHWSALTDLAWTPDARCLAFASTDGTVSFAQSRPLLGSERATYAGRYVVIILMCCA